MPPCGCQQPAITTGGTPPNSTGGRGSTRPTDLANGFASSSCGQRRTRLDRALSRNPYEQAHLRRPRTRHPLARRRHLSGGWRRLADCESCSQPTGRVPGNRRRAGSRNRIPASATQNDHTGNLDGCEVDPDGGLEQFAAPHREGTFTSVAWRIEIAAVPVADALPARQLDHELPAP